MFFTVMILFMTCDIWGQGTSKQPCPDGSMGDNPFCGDKYVDQNWDWEIPFENRDLYCKTWMSRLGPLGSPWHGPGSGKLNTIVNKNNTNWNNIADQ